MPAVVFLILSFLQFLSGASVIAWAAFLLQALLGAVVTSVFGVLLEESLKPFLPSDLAFKDWISSESFKSWFSMCIYVFATYPIWVIWGSIASWIAYRKEKAMQAILWMLSPAAFVVVAAIIMVAFLFTTF